MKWSINFWKPPVFLLCLCIFITPPLKESGLEKGSRRSMFSFWPIMYDSSGHSYYWLTWPKSMRCFLVLLAEIYPLAEASVLLLILCGLVVKIGSGSQSSDGHCWECSTPNGWLAAIAARHLPLSFLLVPTSQLEIVCSPRVGLSWSHWSLSFRAHHLPGLIPRPRQPGQLNFVNSRSFLM